jgi:hypothetical protein
MTYDIFKFRWSVLGAMMVGAGSALAAGALPPWVRALGAALSAGGAAITAFFHKADVGGAQ